MCGIAGFILPKPTADARILEIFRLGLEHRGPDDHGWLVYDGNEIAKGRGTPPSAATQVGLLHRRLSILDLSEAGWQPMSTGENHLHIIFNGEIYNYLELREDLRKLGVKFKTESDTEVLLRAFDVWGKGMLTRLVGMFAFAILDVKMRTIFLARDYFGIKPLYFTHWKNGIAFSSEIPPLLELEGVSRKVNAQRAYDYLRFGLTDHQGPTFFADIQQLQSAHHLTISLDSPQNVEPQRYWKPNIDNTIEISREEATKEVQSIFLENMKLHLRSDVPIGSALSGGLDSTAIISVMRLLQPKLDIHTFSYVANQKSLSEESWIDIANSHVNGINHKVYANANNLHSDLDHLIKLQGEPFGSTSIYAQYMVFQAAKAAGVKVMLDGQGADEMLAGYPVYVAARLASLLKQRKFALALQFLKNTQHLSSYTTSILKTGMFMFPQGVQNSVRSLIGQELVPPELDRKWLENSGVEIQSIRGSYGKNVLKEELKNTLTDLHLSSLLRFEDRNSMIHSIESRVPFLTPKLVDFLFSLPEEYLFDAQGNSKSIFRSAMKSIVPASIVKRKDKIGFETPEREWLREQSVWVESILSDVVVEEISIFKTHRLIEEWRDLLINKKTFDFRVWRWINLILWTKSFKVQY